MKINIVVLFLTVAVATSAASLPAIRMLSIQLPTVGLADIAHRRHRLEKRQSINELTNDDIVDCTSRIYEHQCSSGYAQRIVDIALGCGNDTVAQFTSRSCARNARGDTCAATTLDFISDVNLSQNGQQCSGAVSIGSCPSACRSYLQSARSRLGCCVNTYLNTTVNPLNSLFSVYIDYRLWNLCDVDLPPADCGNALPLNPPTSAPQTCTAEEYLTRLVDYECMDNISEPLVDAVRQNPRCQYFAELFEDSCETNADGQYCAQLLETDLTGGSPSDGSWVDSLTRNCGSVRSTCSSSCRRVLVEAKEAVGCCVNIFNNSDIGVELPSLAYNVWNTCGVETPGFCEDLISTGDTTTTPSSEEYSTTTPSTDDEDHSTNASGGTTPPKPGDTDNVFNGSRGTKVLYLLMVVMVTMASLLI